MRLKTMPADQPATILLVEDDGTFAAKVTQALSAQRWTVWPAETAGDARAVLKQARPDLIVLDLTLPDVDGLVFCTHLKNEAPEVPFMVFGASTTAETVLAFKLGAEDVLVNPFELAELEVRVEAILRRRTQLHSQPGAWAQPRELRSAPTSANLGGLQVDLTRWRITLDGQPLNLTPTEFQLLVFMAHRPGEILSRQELARGVWGDESMSRSRTIDAYVRRISAKLGGSGPRVLSIRGLGYQLASPIVNAA